MRRRRSTAASARVVALATGLAVSACGAPELDLVFSVPAPYGDAVQQVVLRIYEPRGTSAFDCEALAFSTVEEGVLRGTLVNELVLRDAGVLPLSDVDRTSDKLFFVEGLDADGVAVVRGCSAIGTVDDDLELTVVGEPTVELGLVDAPSLSKRVGTPLDGPITVDVRDVLGSALPNVLVLWELRGVGGVASAGEVRTNGVGEVSISPALPTRPGPYLLDLSVRWAEPGPPLATGFVAPVPEVVRLPGPVLEYRRGEIGPNGEVGFVALLEADTRNEVQLAFVYRAGGAVQTSFSPRLPGLDSKLGLFEFREAPDRAVVVSRDAWVEVAPDGILTPKTYRPPVAATGSAPKVVLPTGPCQGTPDSPQLLVTYDANAVGFFDLDANLVGGFGQGLDVLASGCVDDQDRVPIRTLVINAGDAVGLVVGAEVMPNLYVTRPWVAVGSGTAFSPAVGSTGRLLLGTQLNVNDFVVSRASWSRVGMDVELQQEGLDSPPEIPVVNRGGDLDGDETLDVMSLFGLQSVPGGPIRWSVWSVLGQTHRGQRMSGTYDLGETERQNPTLMVLDFDGDGVDDFIVAERQDPLLGPQTETRIEVYPMGLIVE